MAHTELRNGQLEHHNTLGDKITYEQLPPGAAHWAPAYSPDPAAALAGQWHIDQWQSGRPGYGLACYNGIANRVRAAIGAVDFDAGGAVI